MNKTIKITAIIIAVIILILAGIFANQWFGVKKEKIKLGMSEPSFLTWIIRKRN